MWPLPAFPTSPFPHHLICSNHIHLLSVPGTHPAPTQGYCSCCFFCVGALPQILTQLPAAHQIKCHILREALAKQLQPASRHTHTNMHRAHTIYTCVLRACIHHTHVHKIYIHIRTRPLHHVTVFFIAFFRTSIIFITCLFIASLLFTSSILFTNLFPVYRLVPNIQYVFKDICGLNMCLILDRYRHKELLLAWTDFGSSLYLQH